MLLNVGRHRHHKIVIVRHIAYNNLGDSIQLQYRLKEDERSFISETNIHEWFLKNAERYDNIRILKTKLENAVFEKLTDHFIIKNKV